MGPRKRAAAAKAAALAAENGEVEVDEPETTAQPTPSAPAITYYSIEAPPSIKPIKKYCDVTGLIAPYTDPRSHLRYHNPEIYALIKQFGPSTEQGYLSIRGSGAVLR